ncbi:NTF2 fold immunity protein [Pseudomonas sp. S1Bt23]|uniref:NTF2 fold immunity protein n=1 Tax=Pseudomonas sp. S1Bt23 TaxID=3095074 RepID=UPI002A59F831|nr:NTF2 fold immunity protein [Pseudomonas sp. S1Bt23]WPO50160.1 NTF2 fold immunity protein [Pseudomonas sp. S1Bt23]
MNGWKIHYYPEVREKGLTTRREKMKQDLDAIFDSFCTKKERKQGRQTSLLCSDPPEYSPSENILSSTMSGSKAVISTQQNVGFKNQYRYMLNFKSNQWFVDKKNGLMTMRVRSAGGRHIFRIAQVNPRLAFY